MGAKERAAAKAILPNQTPSTPRKRQREDNIGESSEKLRADFKTNFDREAATKSSLSAGIKKPKTLEKDKSELNGSADVDHSDDGKPSLPRLQKSKSVNIRKAKPQATGLRADKSDEERDAANDSITTTRTTNKTNSKPKLETEELYSDEEVGESDAGRPVSRKRKTKEEKEAAMTPLAARTPALRMFVGAHVSIAKGLENAIPNSLHIGGNAFALFLKSQRKWENPPLKAENRDAFRAKCLEHDYDAASHVLPHGSYLVNLAQKDNEKADQAYAAFIDDLHRCEALGIKYYNFHPGAASQQPLIEAIGRLSGQLNRALGETKTVVPVLENMAGGGSVVGSQFSDLGKIIAGIKPEFRSRIGVCIDTCHSFAAGYDLRTPESFKAVLQDFDDTVGMSYLKALHLNDSKTPLNSKRDLHQNIGRGFLGLRAFHNVMNEPRFENLPLILETPCDRLDPSDPKGKKVIEDKSIWAREIKLLESLIGMDPEGSEFKKLEKELSDMGREEREKMQKQFDDKMKKLGKGQLSLTSMFGQKNA